MRQLRRRKLRDIICDNTGIKKTRKNVFLLTGDLEDCRQSEKLDIQKFL